MRKFTKFLLVVLAVVSTAAISGCGKTSPAPAASAIDALPCDATPVDAPCDVSPAEDATPCC